MTLFMCIYSGKVLFNKILDIKNNFTPYERFLYYDNQSNQNTSSAPGLGNNLTDVIPVSSYSSLKAADLMSSL